MARRRKSKPKTTAKAEVEETTSAGEGIEIRVEQTDEGVVKLLVGFVLPPETPPRKLRRRCPQCAWGPATYKDRYASSKSNYFFRCRRCVDRKTGDPFEWKEPLGS